MPTLDLSTAIFGETSPGSGLYWGKYDPPWIVGDEGYPDFWFPGLVLDRTKKYTFTLTFDPTSPDDVGIRRVWITALDDADPQAAYDSSSYNFGDLFNSAGTLVGDVLTVVVMPGTWAGVPSGSNTAYFETRAGGALLDLTYVAEDFEGPDPPAGDGSVDGSQWSNARTLAAGNSNVFDTADIFETAGSGPFNKTYWTFTLTGATRVSLDTWQSSVLDYDEADSYVSLYRCDLADNDLAHATVVQTGDDSADGHAGLLSLVQGDLPAGTYMLVAGTYNEDDVQWFYDYRINAVFTPLVTRHSEWFDELVDDPDNQLVINGADGPFGNGLDLQATQVAEGWRASKPFYASILDRSMPGRLGQSKISQCFPNHAVPPEAGTENPTGDPEGSGNTAADDCSFSHSLNGDQDDADPFNGAIWNTDTYDITLGGPPVCRALGTGAANSADNTAGGYRYYSRYVTDLFLADTISSSDAMGARALWVGRLLSDLQAFYGNDDYHLGTLPSPDRPDGVPDDAVREWESELELKSVKGTADRVNRADYTGLPVSFYVNDPILPTYSGGWSVWQKGSPSAATFVAYGNESTPPLYDFGINSWADTNDPAEGIPDVVIGTGLDTSERPTLAVGDYGIGADSDLAVIFAFNSGRYRWVWTEVADAVATTPPRRFVGRKDELAGGPGRSWPPSPSEQVGRRFAGQIV